MNKKEKINISKKNKNLLKSKKRDEETLMEALERILSQDNPTCPDCGRNDTLVNLNAPNTGKRLKYLVHEDYREQLKEYDYICLNHEGTMNVFKEQELNI